MEGFSRQGKEFHTVFFVSMSIKCVFWVVFYVGVFFSLYYFNYYIVIILLLLFRPCHHCCCWIQTIKCLTLLCASNRPSHVTAHPALML